MANTTLKKVSQLTQSSAATADDLLYVVNDPSGTPSSASITVKNFLESNATANVTANGSLIVQGVAKSKAVVVTYASTPANATAVPTGFSNNTIWTDGSYIYVVTGTGALKRVEVSTW